MRLDQRLCDREAETKTAEVRALTLLESFEDFRERFRIDANAGVLDLNAQVPSCVIRGRNRHLAALGRELDRVFDQVPKNLLQPSRIGVQANVSGGKVRRETNML